MKKHTSFFNQHPELYDMMIPWPQRLARELPFFEMVFMENGVESVADCGCGTGWHTISFARKGMQAFGVDNSPDMLRVAIENAVKEESSAKFFEADFQSVDKALPQKVNAIICLGNSLSIIPSEATVLKTLKSMNRALNKKGILVFQVLNFERMVAQNNTQLPLRVIRQGEKEYLFLRIFDISKDKKAKINFILLTHENDQWAQEFHSTEIFYFTKPLIQKLLKESGFGRIQIYGDMNFSKFSAKESPDFVVIAQKS